MCDEAVNNCPSALKFVSHWFVTDNVIKKLHEALLASDDILFFS